MQREINELIFEAAVQNSEEVWLEKKDGRNVQLHSMFCQSGWFEATTVGGWYTWSVLKSFRVNQLKMTQNGCTDDTRMWLNWLRFTRSLVRAPKISILTLGVWGKLQIEKWHVVYHHDSFCQPTKSELSLIILMSCTACFFLNVTKEWSKCITLYLSTWSIEGNSCFTRSW